MTNSSKEAYIRHVNALVRDNPYDAAMGLAVGGAPEIIGLLELALLRYAGLHEHSYLIDIGCGSGRLTLPLSCSHKGRYLGTDLVPELLHYNQARAQRSDWRFEEVDRLEIPETDSQADIVCFFSVFTHLLHEQTYLYLEEAKRVLRPGGRVVFSFLETTTHWDVFLSTVERERLAPNGEAVPNVFIDRLSVQNWANALGLVVVDFYSGDEAFIPLEEPIRLDDGQVCANYGALGQSVCVLEKPMTLGKLRVTDPAHSETDREHSCIYKLQRELAQQRQEADTLRREITKLHSSTSWRITQPLRRLRTVFSAPGA